MTSWCCRSCGSTNIQFAVWARPNTGEVVEWDGAPCGEPVWCEDCETNDKYADEVEDWLKSQD